MRSLKLEDFETYLAKKRLVPERQRPYLVRWVRPLLQGPGGTRGLLWEIKRLLVVRDGKGDKDRSTVLPQLFVPELKDHLQRVKALHEEDLRLGHGEAHLPHALAIKHPNAGRQWAWQYLFPARSLSVDPPGKVRRHHAGERIIQMAMRQAVARAGIHKPASVHTLRHSFATHLLMRGVNIREVQRLQGHKSLEGTIVYLHVIKNLRSIPVSPLDTLGLGGREPMKGE